MTARAAHIAIVGAGPAGLIAAEHMAQAGHRVVVYDHMPSPARKFLMAGRGGLNLTHSELLNTMIQRYTPASPLLENALHAFNNDALRAWSAALGEDTFIGSSGRVFPKSFKASPLLRAWLRRLDMLGVVLKPRHALIDIDANGNLLLRDDAGAVIADRPAATLLALGGGSWPRLGSTGTWQAILARHAVPLSPIRPANMGFQTAWSAFFAERFAGQPLKNITVRHAEKTMSGEMIITRYGIEGGAVYALSSAMRDAVEATGAAFVHVDLKNAVTLDQLALRLARSQKPKESRSTFLKRAAGLTPAAIGLLHEVSGKHLPAAARELAGLIKSVPVTLHAPQGLDRAISSAGGIRFDGVNDDFMLKAIPGIFAAGEMLDWDAPTGGYLLQAAFATGIAAAKGICNYLENSTAK
ncbi:MAG: NAD(P)/FAD-dependent oxidoreductase [Beijerinckiaceae bacterium]